MCNMRNILGSRSRVLGGEWEGEERVEVEFRLATPPNHSALSPCFQPGSFLQRFHSVGDDRGDILFPPPPPPPPLMFSRPISSIPYFGSFRGAVSCPSPARRPG